MGLALGMTRLFLCIAIIVAVSIPVAEAWFFGNLIKGMISKVDSVVSNVEAVVSNVLSETDKKVSILSSIFGAGMSREDLSLSEIINEVFSRNNGVHLNDSMPSMDWKLGDGSSVIAAVSSGGSVSVTNNNGLVTISTGTHKETNAPSMPENNGHPSPGSLAAQYPIDIEGDPTESEEPRPTPELEDAIEFSGSNLDEAFVELLSDWDNFITSSIWDVQANEDRYESTELQTSSRIINGVFLGNRIAAGAPFAVKFFYNNEENYYCSGSLIGYAYALTAAHCGIVIGDEVRVGGRLLRSGFKANVDEVIIHPHFNPTTLAHDMAIVRLGDLANTETLQRYGVEAAHINKEDSFPGTGFVGVLSAHGSFETDGKSVSNELQSTRNTVYDMQKCKAEITEGYLQDDDGYLCAGDGRRSTACVGDSGGGLWRYRVIDMTSGEVRTFYEIFAIVSFGEVTDEALCPRGPPTVYQRTSTNYDWITKVIGRKKMP